MRGLTNASLFDMREEELDHEWQERKEHRDSKRARYLGREGWTLQIVICSDPLISMEWMLLTEIMV